MRPTTGWPSLQIALDDLDAQVAKFESEIDAVRQREDRDRSLLASGTIDAKQLTDLQHELETLERRQSSLEDSLLEVMERREELQGDQAARAGEDRRAAERAHRRADGVRRRAHRDRSAAPPMSSRGATNSSQSSTPISSRSTSVSGPAAVRVPGCCRAVGAVPAGSRSTKASWRGSPRPPTTRCCAARSAAQSCCGSRVPAREGYRRGRRRFAWQPGSGRLRRGGVVGRPQHGARREQAGDRPRHQQRRRVPRADRGTGGGGRSWAPPTSTC